MKRTFTAKQGTVYIKKNLYTITDIKLVLDSEKSYLQFSISDSSINANMPEWKLVSKIPQMSFISTKGYKIKILNILPTKYTSKTANLSLVGKKLECVKNYDLKCQFTDFSVEKGKYYNTDYEINFFVSNHNFTQDFTTKINDIDISFNNKTSRFVFLKNTNHKIQEISDIFYAIQYLYALYYGYFFKNIYTELKGKKYQKTYGNMNADFEFFSSISPYYFCDTDTTNFQAFLEKTLPTFLNNKDRWRLQLLIEYYLLFTRTHFLQIQYLLLSIFMEALKYSYCKARPNYYKETKNGFKNKKTTRQCYFKNIVCNITKHLKVPRNTRFITKRNKIIHTGDISNITSAHLFPIENTIRLILKVLIGFQGKIYYRNSQGGEYR